MRSKEKKVSICMATYNGAGSITAQLQSILCQLTDWDEVIISDDHSTDDTLAIIKRINDPRIKVHINKGKAGPVGNFENALKNASGNVIFLCDQDDIWFEQKVATHVAAHENFKLVISNATVINKDKKVLFESFFAARGSKAGLFNNLLKNSYIGCCMSFTPEIVADALPFPKAIHMHDWWIGLVGEVNGSVCFIETPMMFYIRHEHNASNTLIRKLPFSAQLWNRIVLTKSLLDKFLLNKNHLSSSLLKR